MGWEVKGGSRGRGHMYTQYCKAIILQLKTNKFIRQITIGNYFINHCSQSSNKSTGFSLSPLLVLIDKLSVTPTQAFGVQCLFFFFFFFIFLVNSEHLGKDSDARKDWRQEEKGATENEMVGWHHWLNVHEFEQAQGNSEGRGSLVCCSLWGHKESDTTEQVNREQVNIYLELNVQDEY